MRSISAAPRALAATWALSRRCSCRAVAPDSVAPVRTARRFLFQKTSAFDDLEVVDVDAFFLDAGGARRHRAGRQAADILMVAAAGDEEQDAAAPGIEHGRHHRDVRQMRAAVVGRVEHIDVAGLERFAFGADDALHRAVHGAQVHRHMRRVGDERAVRVEHGAREVQPLLDVHAICAVLRSASPICSAMAMNRLLKTSSSTGSALCRKHFALARRQPRQHQIIARRDFQVPAGLDDDRLMRLDDERWAGDRLSGAKIFAQINVGIVPGAACERRCGLSGACGAARGFG